MIMQQSPVQMEKGTYVGRTVREHTFKHIITTETTYPAGYTSEWHYHSNPHFSHILCGGSKELVKGQSDLNVVGEGLYYYPGIPHQNVGYQEGTRIFNLELEAGFFKQYELEVPPPSLMFDEQAQLNAKGLIRAMKEHYLHDEQSQMAIEQICISLIQPDEKLFPEWVPKIKAVMQDYWDQPLSLPQLAKELGLHPVTISKYFSKYFNCSAGEYLRRIKVERAVGLIRSGQNSLTEVAYQCGFADQAHFTKMFQRITGMLPRQYEKL
ncbi:helix-turn-helix domain-containing protein [Chitinophaga silvisoli]|uniref:AraC family transcriptional regulator n=1 Tax=Chitinophaga silvisoli TaxID=2291814 RepID=A0A3E1NSW1_9BACT|nr:AraC family transcriptional regulator [Chitinophaga silvisoli]RFM30858.1 AraC family transcriptional regulator [Chitinophaga silvisoli]